MRKRNFELAITAIIFVAVSFFNVVATTAQDSKLNPITNPTLDELRKNFAKPHRDFSTGPLWTWNDRLTDEQVRGTLRDLAGQHVKQVWVHPRPGLMTPYLSDEWFARWKTALDEAEKLDMNVWIYDENSYPSGFAGGFVPEALPDSRGMGLKFEEVEKLDQWDKNIWYVFCPQKNPLDNLQDKDLLYKNITAESQKAAKLEPLPNNRKYLLGKVQYTPQGGWFGGKWYVDLLKKGVTEKFLDITLDAYKNVPEIQKQFGKRVPGIFTDEPHPAGSYVGTWITWNEEIPELFEKRFGYSLIDNLPSLLKNIGDWRKVRHNYHQLILDLFVERWAKPYFERCEKYGLEFTGHYWEHGWPGTSHGPDNMAMYAWHQRPAIDLLMNTYNDNSPNAQFGNVRSVKELASVANQMGHARTLSENYGAGGWDIRFEDLKRLGDWSYALGVNTNNEHLSYVTIKGARKRDHPQSFSYHASWFEGYHVLADYFTRLSYMLSQGRQKSRVVIIEPTTTAWMYQGDPKLNEIGQSFTDFLTSMERVRSVHHAKPEYDLTSEDIIKRIGKVDGKNFIIGQATYEQVILPPMMENLNQATLDLLVQYSESGGTIIFTGTVPTYIDGCNVNNKSDSKNATLIKKLSERYSSVKKTVSEVVAEVSVLSEQRRDDYFRLRTDDESVSSVFFHRRQLDDCDIVFICNTSLTNTAKGDIDVIHDQIEEWDLMTGEIRPLNLSLGGLVRMPHIHYFYKFELPPAGSVLLVLSEKTGIKRKEIETNKDEKSSPISKEVKPPTSPLKLQRFDSLIIKDNFDAKTQKNITPIPALNSETKVRRLEDNVLTLDYVDVKVGDEERKDIYAWAANRFMFQKHGMDGNPWDNQVQFKDELITKKFPEKSGFEATYHFTLRESIPNNL
ncbi:MAG: hypothetical protein LBL39_06990, partial [Planctomycetaceae bacterium]|nr:hypothetical protein [Planctomycetaceae bacterium]